MKSVQERMQKHTGFRLWDLCIEMERRFSTAMPLKKPDQMAYYATFHLQECDTEHTWIFFLDAEYVLCKALRLLAETVIHSDCADYVWENRDAWSYFYIASISESSIPTPNEIQRRTNYAYSRTFCTHPKYLGMILVSKTMDYLFLPPGKR